MAPYDRNSGSNKTGQAALPHKNIQIFLRLEIANPEIWKSEFRYSEIVFFVLNYSSISMGIFVKALPHLRCVAAFTNIPVEIMIQYTQKRI